MERKLVIENKKQFVHVDELHTDATKLGISNVINGVQIEHTNGHNGFTVTTVLQVDITGKYIPLDVLVEGEQLSDYTTGFWELTPEVEETFPVTHSHIPI